MLMAVSKKQKKIILKISTVAIMGLIVYTGYMHFGNDSPERLSNHDEGGRDMTDIYSTMKPGRDIEQMIWEMANNKVSAEEEDDLKTNMVSGQSQDIKIPPTKTRYSPVSDYDTFPCLTGLSKKRRQLRKMGQCVRTVNVQKMADSVQDEECVDLKITKPTPICINDPRFDWWVSRLLLIHGIWEETLVVKFSVALTKIENVTVLDIGCNIGVYTLSAAKLGKRVVSIDANFRNLRLLSKSITMGGFTDHVTLIWNAVSDKYDNVSLVYMKKSIASNFIDADTKPTEKETIIQTILLDDIESLFTNRPVVIKIDVELFEYHVLQGGHSFFRNIDVRFVQMEIRHHLFKKTFGQIVSFFKDLKFGVYPDCLSSQSLANQPFETWPHDVCFIKSKKN